jgi:predicted CXXCH cytochrome family protein
VGAQSLRVPENGTAGLPENTNEEDYMKTVKLSLIIVAATAVVFGLSGTGFAFHSGGVADCMGCHEMHAAAGPNLLQGPDNSSTCLNCHNAADTAPNDFHVSTDESILAPGTPPSEMTPGGDFGWLKKSYLFTVLGSLNTDSGQTHGHNINSSTYNYLADTDNAVAPGGTFQSNQLACTSCHDMHGKGRYLTTGAYAKSGEAIYTSGSYGAIPTTSPSNLATGVYRMLRGTGDTVNVVTFASNPPVAVVPSIYNRSEYYTQTRTAYGSGMSPWCGTCHPDMHSTAGILRHPEDQVMSGAIQGNYNSYVKSGDMTGSPTTSYLSLIPYEEGLTYSAANITTLNGHAQIDDSYLNGPTGAAQVMCLSCHRAHATGFPSMTRWSNAVEFIVYNGLYPGIDSTPTTPEFARGRNSTETAASYYNRNVTKFATYQRSLCNKCHAQD